MRYTCPMHPEVVREQPGICPECGMNLVPSKEKQTPDKHAGHSTAAFLQKFWVSLLLTIPVVVLNFSSWEFPGSQYIPLILGTAIFFYGGWVFIRGAAREVKARLPGMMTLIAIAISTAYFYSIFSTFSGGDTLFWELTTLITVMLMGHWLEMRSVSSAQGALKELSKLLPDTAEMADGRIVPLSELKVGDIISARPGGRIPADGVVAEGQAEVNEAMITGESAPILKKPGSEVIAGTINGDGFLKIKIAKIGENTFLAGVMRLVAEAQASKSRLQILSDRAAFYLTLVAVFGGSATLISWIISGAGTGFAVERMVAVLVIACPHALGLAVPLVASISTTLAARNGFLVKRRLALESARSVDVILFDKTGTLTKGEYGVMDVWAANPENETEVLKMAASVDVRSEHFISKAIVQKAKEKNIALDSVSNFARIAGRGVKGTLGSKEILVGGEGILEYAKATLPDDLKNKAATAGAKGNTVIYILEGTSVLGAIALADLIREESREAVTAIKKMGIKTAMITGDSEEVARWVAGELGIDEYFSRVLPEKKSEKVGMLQKNGRKVAMVGDGINDAPALTQADLGIAIGAGTNVAIESAGIILMKNDPRDIVKIIRLSKLTYSKMLQNLFWATGYNVVAMPLAAGILISQGIVLQPALAALLMSVSTVIVALNAVLLKRRRL
ncbi:MAG: putative copper-exporting P-type ATPase B [Parcubacteria group bacterium Gr01-1014_19]|nr:MAG: putative copper-exporting P-type ATPase B [Parcubacteria group bacterium Gr01-1014_19]